MFQAPLLAVWPGLAIALSVLGLNLLGDGLRDLLDPDDTRALNPPWLCLKSQPHHQSADPSRPGLRPCAMSFTLARCHAGPDRRIGLRQIMTALALMGLLPEHCTGGRHSSIQLDDQELLGLSERQLCALPRQPHASHGVSGTHELLNPCTASAARWQSRCAFIWE